MRDDEGLGQNPETDFTPDDRPTSARSPDWWVAPTVLALLMAATSWVIATSATPWLVPPYLVLMALILPSPTARHQGESAADGSDSGPATVPGSSPPVPPPGVEPGEGREPIPAPGPVKARRGKGRPRKIRPAPEPAPAATWIEVGPGKFVRAEAPSPMAEPEPHVEVGPESEPQLVAHEGPDPSRIVEGIPEADGDVMPPADDPLAEPATDRPEETPVAEADEAEGWAPTAEPEPTPAPGPLEVPPDRGDPPRLTEDSGLDPTEITVDETDLDDAEPDPVPPAAIVPEAGRVDAPPEPGVSPGNAPPIPSRWYRRPASTRPLRSLDRGTPARHPARPKRPDRRPADPRRLARRGAGRPRQFARTFPPRSPPGGGLDRRRLI